MSNSGGRSYREPSDAVQEPVTALIVDDHPVSLAGASALLVAAGINVVATASGAELAVELARKHRPRVVLLDLRVGDSDPPETVRRLRGAVPSARILLFTATPAHPSAAAALAAGAFGCLGKDVLPDRLASVVRQAANGRRAAEIAGTTHTPAELTLRQVQILERVATGHTNREIAGALFLTPNTVKTYWQQALAVLGARNRIEAIARAHDLGLL